LIPKIIHYCWLSNDPVPDDLKKYMLSWKEKLFDYKFMFWNFDRFDINSSNWVKFFFEQKKYAIAADYIRLFAIYKYGGIYLDMDIEVLKSFNPLLNNDCMIAYENNKLKDIEAGCFGAIKEFWFIGRCLEYLEKKRITNYDGTFNIIPLPRIMRTVYNETRNVDNEIIFFTEDYFTAKSHVTGEVAISHNTYCIHNFSASWLSKEEKFYLEMKRRLCHTLGVRLGLFFSFPFLLWTTIRDFGIIVGIKKGFVKVYNYFFS
jgi:mannosyltransferase OCH1-like enzyme